MSASPGNKARKHSYLDFECDVNDEEFRAAFNKHFKQSWVLKCAAGPNAVLNAIMDLHWRLLWLEQSAGDFYKLLSKEAKRAFYEEDDDDFI